jgi:hypothetical protein
LKNKKKKKTKDDGFGFFAVPDLTSIGDVFGASNKAKERAIRKIIGFPTTWANTEFLSGREWWVQSKKKGEGGRRSRQEFVFVYVLVFVFVFVSVFVIVYVYVE